MGRQMGWVVALGLMACNSGDKDEGSDTDVFDTDTGAAAGCGDGVLQGAEVCDFGEDNAPDGNCLADCTLADAQRWVASRSALPDFAIDADGVEDASAPLGTGAWIPSDSNRDLNTITKFNLNIPLFDARGESEVQGIELPWPELEQITSEDFIGEVTVADIAEIAFDATTPAGDRQQYFVNIYTTQDGLDDTGSWYGRRLQALAWRAREYTPQEDTWQTWSSAAAVNQLVFYDADEPTSSSLNAVPLTDLSGADAFSWADPDTDDSDVPTPVPYDYGSEVVRYVSIQTSSGEPTINFDGAIDNVILRLVDGRSLTVDLEP